MSSKQKTKCYYCSGPLDFGPDEETKICRWCHRENRRPADTGVVDPMINAAELRNNGLFDAAAKIYDTILGRNPYDYNALWGMVLCKYGVVFVERNSSERLITCRKRVEKDIKDDRDYKDLVNCKIPESVYRQILNDTKTITDIQNKIRAYGSYKCDVFLCYKETDEKGERTEDSYIAEHIYFLLKNVDKYRVFFARETLKNKVGADYEALIFNAVKSAPIMIVIGTEKKYLTSTWVKNEWSRYLELINEGEYKTIISLSGKTANLPEKIKRFQALNINEGRINDYTRLREVIKGLLSPESSPEDIVTPGRSDVLKDKVEEGSALYYDGKIDEAIACYKKAESKGNDTAAYLVGCIYYNDKEELANAFKHFNKAAELGNTDAMYQLGFMYEFGIGVKRDRYKARTYYYKASELGNYEVPPGF